MEESEGFGLQMMHHEPEDADSENFNLEVKSIMQKTAY